jgi:transposase-like protein
MVCPRCGAKTIVADVGMSTDENVRRRRCKECLLNFYTLETDVDPTLGYDLLYKYKYSKYPRRRKNADK